MALLPRLPLSFKAGAGLEGEQTVEQKPPVSSHHETQSQTKRQKAETAHTAVRNANEKRTMEGLVGLAPKYRREVVREEREQDDGT